MALTTVTGSLVSVNAIQGTLIADNAITAVHIATNAVSGTLIADNAITAVHIAQNSITVTQLADDCVESDKIADGIITTNHLNKAMISSQTEVTAATGDFVLLGDTSDSNNLKKTPVSSIIGLASGTTINNNADNRLITGSGTANTLNGESTLTFDGNNCLKIIAAGNTTNGGNIQLGITTDDAAKYTAITANQHDSGTETEGFLLIGGNSAANDSNLVNIGGGFGEANPATQIQFYTGSAATREGTNRMVIDPSGNIGLGTTTPSSYDNNAAGISSNLVVKDSGHSGIIVIAGTGSDAAISFGDGTGAAAYRGAVAYVNSQDALYFKTASSNRMVIDSSGKLLVGNTSSGGTGKVQADVGFDAQDGSNTTSIAIRNYSSAANSGSIIVDPDNVGASSVMYFGIDGITPAKMKLDSAGRLNIDQVDTRFGSGALNITGEVGNSYDAIQFRHNASTIVGRIRTAASSTSYNTSSDYRLKENVDYTWDATTRLKQLKPARFNFIIDDTNTLVDGFLAHEVSSIVPEAITGTKDAVDSEGNPEYQGIDHSKLVPLLVKTIQELEARITELEG